MKRRSIYLCLGLLIFVLLAGGGILLEHLARPVLRAGPMVQTPANDTLVVVWETEPAWWIGGRVEVEGVEKPVVAQVMGLRHEATFIPLKPGSTYTYRVFGQGLFGRSIPLAGPFSVKMPSFLGNPVRFIAFGDSGSGSASQVGLARLMVEQKPDVVIHVGDLIYPGGEAEGYLERFYKPYAGLLPIAPFMPVLGNHDCMTDQGTPLLRNFVLPPNGPAGLEPERNYFFDFGDARFIALDTNVGEGNRTLTAEQMKTMVVPWMQPLVTRSLAKWKFAYFHHPYYTNSLHEASEGAPAKAAYAPLFEENGVDIVFQGHNHMYERTAPMRADKIMPEGQGVVYITTGAGGANRYAVAENRPEYMRVQNDSVFSFTVVDINGGKLNLRQIDERGKVIDEYVIEKAGRP